MEDTENFTDENLDILNHTEHLENNELEELSEQPGIHDTTFEDSEQISSEKRPEQAARSEVIRFTKLPVSRVKSIMKMDPDVNLLRDEAVFLVTKATELFLTTLVQEAKTHLGKKKTLTQEHIDKVINSADCMCFLEGALDF